MNSKDYLEELRDFIDAGRDSSFRKIAHATYAVRTQNMFAHEVYGIQYHNTVIFGIRYDGSYFINNGGYFTTTTKKRINDSLTKCGHGYSPIVQRNKRWLMDNVEFGRTACALFDVDMSVISSNPLDCWARSVAGVEEKIRKIRPYYVERKF